MAGGRPTLGESETKRLHMAITEAELSAIEDWQHENRIASKSEAIRKLVKIGLQSHVPICSDELSAWYEVWLPTLKKMKAGA